MIDVLAMIALATGPADMPDSLYQGSHYVATAEPFRKCVMWRESRGRYKADSQYGSGAYQIIGSTWQTYARQAGYPEWADKRPAKAPRYVQDEVFWVMVNPKPNQRGLEGRQHWSPKWALTIGKTIPDCP